TPADSGEPNGPRFAFRPCGQPLEDVPILREAWQIHRNSSPSAMKSSCGRLEKSWTRRTPKAPPCGCSARLPSTRIRSTSRRASHCFTASAGNGRLELDYPTISLTDLVLEKLQIHRIGRKDLVDLLVLFLGHEVKPGADGDHEVVDADHVTQLLADDWGFWYESIQNLAKARQL